MWKCRKKTFSFVYNEKIFARIYISLRCVLLVNYLYAPCNIISCFANIATIYLHFVFYPEQWNGFRLKQLCYGSDMKSFATSMSVITLRMVV